MSSKATVTITGPRETLELLGQREVILLPLEEYEALLERIEDLEDILESRIALEEYRAGAGRPLEEYLAERRERHRVQGRDGQQAS